MHVLVMECTCFKFIQKEVGGVAGAINCNVAQKGHPHARMGLEAERQN